MEQGVIQLEEVKYMYEIYCGLCDIIEEVNEEFSNLVKSIE